MGKPSYLVIAMGTEMETVNLTVRVTVIGCYLVKVKLTD